MSKRSFKQFGAIALTLTPFLLSTVWVKPASAQVIDSGVLPPETITPTDPILETPILVLEPQPTAISILNPSFEEDLVGGDSAVDFITGWQILSSSAWSVGVYRPASGFYASQVPDGVNVAFANSGSLFQRLTDLLTANLQYTLSVNVGSRPPYSFPGYQIDLLAGETVIATANAPVPEFSQFINSELTYIASETDLLLGQPLAIRLSSGGFQVNFDHVRLTSLLLTPSVPLTPVVEEVVVGVGADPSTLLNEAAVTGEEMGRAIALEITSKTATPGSEVEPNYMLAAMMLPATSNVGEVDVREIATTERVKTEVESVPEPASVVGLLVSMVSLTQLKRKRRQS